MNDIETHVLRLIGENISTPDVFTDDDSGIAQIRTSLNDAIQELCMVTGSYRRTYHLSLLANRQFYRLAPQNDFLGWIVGVRDRSQKRSLHRTDVLAISAADPWWMKRTGPPLEYMQLGLTHIGIYMAPSTNGVVIEADCVMIPKPYTEDTAPVRLRDNYKRAAVYYAVSEFYASRGDAARAGEYLQRYLEMAGLKALHPSMAERQYRLGGYEKKVTAEVPA
jgi:hypothetical protein